MNFKKLGIVLFLLIAIAGFTLSEVSAEQNPKFNDIRDQKENQPFIISGYLSNMLSEKEDVNKSFFVYVSGITRNPDGSYSTNPILSKKVIPDKYGRFGIIVNLPKGEYGTYTSCHIGNDHEAIIFHVI
jgi:hypothetical protein